VNPSFTDFELEMNGMREFTTESASILCVGLGWFPKTPGGLDRYVYELTQELASKNDRVELCGVGLPEQSNSLVKLTNLASTEKRLPHRLWTTRKRFLQRQSPLPDAINLHFALYSLPLLNSLPNGIPVTFNFHGPWALESQWEGEKPFSIAFKRWVEQRVYHRCDRFIVLSRAFGDILHQEYGISWEQIHVIPGGVDVHRFQPSLSRQAARTQLNWDLDRPILFTPRRLVHRMGIDKLLTALVQVKAVVPDVWLAIAGKGALRAALEQQVADLGLEENVKFLGFLPDQDLPLAYQAADMCVVPSQALEGFGLILLESLACGTPALCTPVGGMPEVLAPFAPELVTASPEPDAIAERLLEALLNKIEIPTQAECRNYAVTHFNWQSIAQQVREVLLCETRLSTPH